MKKPVHCILWLSVAFISSSYALETLPEEEMAETVAQTGVTFLVQPPANGWIVRSIGVGDLTGIDSSIKPGYDFNRGDMVAMNLGFKTCTESTINGTCTAVNGPTLNFSVDMTGDADNNGTTNDPLLNISMSLVNGANKIRLYIDKIALRNGSGSNQSTIIDFVHSDAAALGQATDSGKDYIDILPTGSNLFTIQLANENQGSMFAFSNLNLAQIDFGEVRLVDKTDTGVSGNNHNLRFNFTIDNLNLNGASVDLAATGLQFRTPNLNNMNVTFGNISIGSSAVNMGTIGLMGLNLSNHTLTIAGKS